MKRKSISIYTAVISAVFAFALIFFAANLAAEAKTGASRAKNTFDALVTSVKNARTPEEIKPAALSRENYSALFIAENGNPLIAFPNESAKNAENTRFVTVYRVTVNRGKAAYDITAAIYTLRPSVVFYYARFSFIIIMVATLLTIVLIIYISCTEKKSADTESSSSEEIEEQGKDSACKMTEAENNEDTTPENRESEAAATAQAQLEYPASDDTDTADEPAETNGEAAGNQFLPQNEENEAKDTFSPVTGLSWESQLKPRLETELVRTASLEQDISLLLIKIPNLTFTDSITKEITAYLLKELPFRDKLFEYKDNSFAMIKGETSIEEAEEYAETLHSGLTAILSPVKKDCCIGISSRSTRMLTAERLIMEADEAVNHAEHETTSKIIGFHVDVEKYRQFIKNS